MKIIRDYAADNSAQLISSDNHITVFYTSIYPYRQWNNVVQSAFVSVCDIFGMHER